MNNTMQCSKGHEVKSWILKLGERKVHRVHCPVCKSVSDFYVSPGKIKVKHHEIDSSQFYIDERGRLVDKNYWAAYVK